MPPEKVYDIVGIGIGPFNLGLAALCHDLPELNCLFIDQNETFNWHAGMMIPETTLQVPWYADLVSLALPCSKFIYMNFLHQRKRQFRFGISDPGFIKRSVYNEYCRWVSGQLPTLQFGTTCTSIEKENHFYRVKTSRGNYLTQKLVLGTGTVPFLPECARAGHNHENLFHSSAYLFRKQDIIDEECITLVGSGQSAAEIFYDLLQSYPGQLHWFTRSARFFPMDFSKLSLELSTPDYIDHFYGLPERKKRGILSRQDDLYKGINRDLIDAIYDRLEEMDSPRVHLHTNCELNKITGDPGDLTLSFLHTELEKTFTHPTRALILATGYQPIVPECMKPLRPFIQLDKEGHYRPHRNYSVDDHNSIFIQNAEQPTHGFNASDLSLGPYRNAVILNTILGREHFTIEKGITFQTFGLPE